MLIPTKFNGFVESRRLYFKGGGSSDARKMEQERQARVDAAVKAINDIFDPQPYVTVDLDNRVTSYDPSQTYYLADGSVFDPTSTRTETYRYKPYVAANRSEYGYKTGTRTVSYLDWDKIDNAIASGALYGSKTVIPDGREKLYEDQRDAVYEINSREVNRQYGDAERNNRFGAGPPRADGRFGRCRFQCPASGNHQRGVDEGQRYCRQCGRQSESERRKCQTKPDFDGAVRYRYGNGAEDGHGESGFDIAGSAECPERGPPSAIFSAD